MSDILSAAEVAEIAASHAQCRLASGWTGCTACGEGGWPCNTTRLGASHEALRAGRAVLEAAERFAAAFVAYEACGDVVLMDAEFRALDNAWQDALDHYIQVTKAEL